MSTPSPCPDAVERQVTFAAHGHVLTNTGVWSSDSLWILYDTRSDPAGAEFDGSAIERVHVETGEIQRLYTSKNGAHCGVATCHPQRDKVVFILGPEHPTPDWMYGQSRRQGVVVDIANPGIALSLDARDLIPPFTPGALRGGSHVHVFSPDGQLVSFTYNDQVLSERQSDSPDRENDTRNVAVASPFAVHVPKRHARNHDGAYFSVLVTRTHDRPIPGSDQIRRAFEDAWVGSEAYMKPDATHHRRAIAFQGEVLTTSGVLISEVFIVDLPDDLKIPSEGPLQGTPTTRPRPPRGTIQRRLTRTADRKHPGIQGPRHWLRSSPDGSKVACLMKDDAGIVQIWTVSPTGGEPTQLSRCDASIASAFTWSSDGSFIAHVMDGSVCVTEMRTGDTHCLTPKSGGTDAPRPEACVFSPDGRKIAFVRNVESEGRRWNQVFVLVLNAEASWPMRGSA